MLTISAFETKLSESNQVADFKKPYYISWVKRFLSFLSSHKIEKDQFFATQTLNSFITELKSQNKYQDWQLAQANHAVYLFEKAQSNHTTTTETLSQLQESKEDVSLQTVLGELSDILKVKHYSPKTLKNYSAWVKHFFEFQNDSFENATAEDVKKYLVHLAKVKKVSSSTQNQAFNALMFLFRNILHRNFSDLEDTSRAKRSKRIPAVLGREEVKTLFACIDDELHLLIAKLLYGCGLRLLECMTLRVQDIDFQNNLVIIHSGKGDKDRRVGLPLSLKSELETHVARVRVEYEEHYQLGHARVKLPDALARKYPLASRSFAWQWLFPGKSYFIDKSDGQSYRPHLHESNIQKMVFRAMKKSGICKKITVHTLRHSYATHLLDSGVGIKIIQELLGHANIESTMIYTHVTLTEKRKIVSPLDEWNQN